MDSSCPSFKVVYTEAATSWRFKDLRSVVQDSVVWVAVKELNLDDHIRRYST